MNTCKVWKAFRRNSQGQLCFLFRCFKGSSVAPLDVWLETKRPWVSDGRRRTKYRAAFHFLKSQNDIDRFNRLTKNKYVIKQVLVSSIEKKPHSSVNSWLAKRIYIPK